MPTLNIPEYCGHGRVTRADGARVRAFIEQRWGCGEPIVLDFSGVRIASVSFLDEALGLLARTHPVEELARRVRAVNMDKSDRALLNRIVQSRARERCEPQEGSPSGSDGGDEGASPPASPRGS